MSARLSPASLGSLIGAWTRLKFFGGAKPLFASWNITYRCNLRCHYCGVDQKVGPELTTERALILVEELADSGVRWITFSGGEPLLRKDLFEITRRARERGIALFLSTNGRFVPENLEGLKYFSQVTLSCDGPREIHDAARGAGSYDAMAAAAGALREAGVRTSLQCVLSSANCGAVDEVLRFGSERGLPVMFQPATGWLEATRGTKNPIAPEAESYGRAVARLVELKRAGRPVANSYAGLAHLARFPEPASLPCLAGRLTVNILPDGSSVACDFDQRGQALSVDTCCRQCWCAPLVELFLAFDAGLEPLWNLAKMELFPICPERAPS